MSTNITASQITTSTQNITINQPTKMNFARTVKNNTFPKKEQGLIITPTDETNTEDYVYAIGDMIGPQNITHASKKNKRIYLFLSNKEQVDTIIKNQDNITVNNSKIIIRRLVNPALRVIISNVCPTIPHDIITDKLNNLGLTLVSPITFLHAGLKREEYKHILSSRRQVYIAENEEISIPDRTELEYDETIYQIYLALDIPCSKCKQRGHPTNNCPNQITETTELEPFNKENSQEPVQKPTNFNKNIQNPEENLINLSPTFDITETMDTEEQAQQSNLKRPATSLSSTDDLTIFDDLHKSLSDSDDNKKEENGKLTEQPPKTKKKQKKHRSLSPRNIAGLSIDDQLANLKTEINNNQSKYKITYETLIQFIEETQDTNDKLKVARKYTNNITDLINTLKSLQPNITYTTTKANLTKLINKIKEQLDIEIDNIITTSPVQ